MRTLIVGIGNLLLGDEGVGCRCVAALESRYSLPPEVVCEDGGTSGFELLPLIEDADTLIVIDAVTDGRTPGTVILAEDDAVPRTMQQHVSLHQTGFCEVLAAAAVRDRRPGRLLLFGVEPKLLELGMELSPEAAQGMEKALEAVVKSLRDMGHQVQPKQAA